MPYRPIALLLLAALFVGGTAAGADISTLTGKKYKGEIDSLTPDVLTVKTDVGKVGISVKDVFNVDYAPLPAAPKDAKFDEVELTDGSVFRASKFAIVGKAVKFECRGPAGAFPMEVPLDTVFSLCRGADDAKNKADWKKLLATRGKRDLFVVRQGDGLNPVSGTVLGGNAAGDAVEFEKDDGSKTTFKLIRASGGLVFNQPPKGVIPPTVCKVHDLAGNVLTAAAVEIEGPGLKVKTVGGADVAYATTKLLAKLDFSQGNVAYLSDMEPQVSAPEAVPGEPYFTYLRDKTDENGPLKLDGQSFAKGLWVFPDTALTYKLNGDYRELKATVGIDDSVPVASAAVRLIVTADDKPVFNEIVSRKDKPRQLVLDVKGAKVLKIAVERGALYQGNQLNLAEVRVQK